MAEAARRAGARPNRSAPDVPGDARAMTLVPVLDTAMAVWEQGPAQGDPVVFLHGNPTSSFVWRNIVPPVAQRYRCLAPDLLGMGRSPTMPGGGYRFLDHARYLDAWFDSMALDRPVTLVVQDWGSALGFRWARRNPQRVRAIVHMESIAYPRRWSDWTPERAAIFRRLRSAEGEALVLDGNFFVEQVLPSGTLGGIAPAVLDVFRHPFRQRAARLPTLVWPRELPVEGEPADVVAEIDANARFLETSLLPKLLLAVAPGSMVAGRILEAVRRWPNQREITVPGRHFVQEDSAPAIAAEIAAFLASLEQRHA